MADKHDDEFTEDELRQLEAAWALVRAERDVHGEPKADEEHEGENDHRLRYERIPLRGAVPHGGFRLSNDVVARLGNGDPRTAGAVLRHLFAVYPDNPTIVGADSVRALGHGNINAGRRALQKFIALLRRGGTRTVEQPDGHNGRVA